MLQCSLASLNMLRCPTPAVMPLISMPVPLSHALEQANVQVWSRALNPHNQHGKPCNFHYPVANLLRSTDGR